MVAGDTVNIMHTSHVSPRISCLRRIFPYSLQAGACSLPLGTPTHSNACLCEHINQAFLRYPPSARFGRLVFSDHFFCKHSIHSDFLQTIFANKKLKTHLREHSRQSPVPKIRSCFLSEFSVVGRTRFFLLSLFRFFPFSSERKRERNE